VVAARASRTSPPARRALVWASLVLVVACTSGAPTTPPPSAETAGPTGPGPSVLAPTDSAEASGRVILIGTIVTMAEPAVAEAIAIEDGRVTAVGTRDEVMALADDETRIIELGDNVAYPGFIDAHAHWIGDREYYGIDSPAAAMDAAISRGWTSISEQWVNPERLEELTGLAADDALPLRVDAYPTSPPL
jgi:predicted amidohydrolase YtcJ